MEKKNPNKIGETSPTFHITKACELISRIKNEPEPQLIWNGIVEGSKGLIVGISKTGKTTLAENLAISLAIGRESFLGQGLPGKPEKVLFINMEESYRVRSRRNLKQINSLTTDELNLFDENYLSTPEDFPEFLITEDNWQYMTDYIRASNAKYVFIDSLSHMFEGQIEISEPAIKFVKRFRKYLSSLNKTIIVIHHNTKGNDKPIDQNSIAGSRIIAQEFEYAIGLSNIPTQSGGNYLCMLYNKYIEKDDTTVTLYKVSNENWVQNLGLANKFNLYSNLKVDYRENSSNKDLIYNYLVSQSSQDSRTFSTQELKKEFVENQTMSKQTFHESINHLVKQGDVIKPNGKGLYRLNDNIKNTNG